MANKGVLVTRPTGQAQRLCAMIEAAGLVAVHLPAIEIGPPANNTSVDAVLLDLESYQLAVFVSVNAVHAALPLVLAQRSWPKRLKIAVVGPTSAAAIEDHGLQVDYVPQDEFSSEGLLAVDGLQDMHGKKAVIFRGNGGRSRIKDSLTARGATVVYAEVYSRRCPEIESRKVVELLQQKGLDIVIATSNETLQNLFEMAGSQGETLLRDKLFVVPGIRQQLLAKQLGCRKTAVLAGNASDEAMLKKILACEEG